MDVHLDAVLVAQAQRRLGALGHGPLTDEVGEFGPHTTVALQAFQRERGLRITGELDDETWLRLIEAGWRLGDRLLYLDRPLQRGDDVAALQEALALLGFNPGRIDGIFGSLTADALGEFQRDTGLDPTGVMTGSTLRQLIRLGSPGSGRRPVTETRASARRTLAASRVVALVGTHPLVADLERAFGTALEVRVVATEDHHAAATIANAADVGLLIAVTAGSRLLELHYYASYRSLSIEGRELAEAIAELVRRDGGDAVVDGMSVPILRETSMPSLAISVGELSATERDSLARAVVASAGLIVDRSR